ncbi:MAG: hypothetical protein ACPGT1_08265 [Ilumatobacteraceae bacterium]
MPPDIIDLLDRLAKERYSNRSQVIVDMARKEHQPDE